MKKIFLFIVASFVLVSCKKNFLDTPNPNQLADDNFWLNGNDARLGVNGIFDVLQDKVMYGGNLNGTQGMPHYDTFTDNSYNGFKWEGPGNYVEGNVSVGNTVFLFRDFWASNYKGIVRSNIAIDRIEKMDSTKITSSTRTLLLSQAHFLRGLFYFNIAVYYGDAPLITKPQTIQEASVTKSTQQQILDQVVNDLTYAAQNLPPTVTADQFGYATQGAAYGLLARVQLFNKNWAAAAAAAKAVIDLNQYNLTAPYNTLFTTAGETTKEIVFSVRFQEVAGYNTSETFGSTFTVAPKVDAQPMPNAVKDFYCTDGKPITSSPLYNANTPKANRDPRLIASVWFKGDNFLKDQNGNNIFFNGNNNTGYGLRKYVHTQNSPNGTNVAGGQSQDFYILRYADILLMRAEALIELGDGAAIPEVYSLINQVRARPGVNMPTVQVAEGANLTLAQLRPILRHERRVELAFEGLRFFDLKRWGLVQQAYTTMIADNITGYNP
ncbi:RagB/SusD family nutrient uptake outer membrane protein, partial [Pelobium sp.]